MLTPDQVKPLLLHDDRFIRDAAAHYFTESWSRDPEILPMILDAVERFGHRRDRDNLHGAHQLVLSAPSFERILRLLAETTDRQFAQTLSRVITAAPVELWADRLDELIEIPNFNRDQIKRIQRTREMAGWPDDQLWQYLQDTARKLDSDEDGLDRHEWGDLIRLLAARERPGNEEVLQLLNAPETRESWLEVFLFELVGARRLEEAIPALIQGLHVDEDFVLESSSQALVRIGTEEVVRQVMAAYPQAPEHFQFYAASMLGQIKQPASQEAILRLLSEEAELVVLTLLCNSLCELFSRSGVEIVRRQIHAGYDDSMLSLSESLLPVVDALGIELPEVEPWRADRDRRERHSELLRAQWEREWSRYEDVLPSGDALGGLGDEYEYEYEPRDPQVTMPIRHEGPRVGRNDPCPCGSGKKFKKCCGRAGSA